jgi:ATP-binding cassette subfamily B protein/ATP-binding cassette subfamily C protein
MLGAPKSAIISLIIFSFFTNLLMLTVPLYMLQVFDRVLSSRSTETLVLLTMVAFGALFTSAVIETIRSRLLMRLSNRIHGMWGRSLMNRYGSGPGNEGIQRLRDLAEIKSFVGGGGLTPLLDIPWLPFYIGVLWLFAPLFGIIAVIGGLVILGIVLVSEWRMRDDIEKTQHGSTAALVHADVMSQGGDTVRALGMIDRVSTQYERLSFASMRDAYAVTSRLVVDSNLAKFIRMIVQIGVLGGAAYMVTLGELTPGVMIAGSILIARALAPLEAMIGGWRGVVSTYHAYQRVQADTEASRPEHLRAIERLKGKISLSKVTVVRDRQTVLNNINLTVQPGEMLAIIGPSGSGKSTLVKNMLGLMKPSLGKVLLDDIEIGQRNPDDLGQYIGYLAQQSPLFTGSIGQNIARLNPEATPEEIAVAGRRAFAHDMILRLPNGYETPLGPEHPPLPKGHAQRVAFARALYGDPRILVLDEPETFLDPEGEQALYQALTALKRAKITTIIVTNRPQILSGVDRILKLKEGTVQAIGPAMEVIPQLAQLTARAEAESATNKDGHVVALPDGQVKKPTQAAPSQARQTTPGAAPAQSASSKPAETSAGQPEAKSRFASVEVQQDSQPAAKPEAPSAEAPRPEARPGDGALKEAKALADSEQLTLSAWLNPQTGALGSWIRNGRGQVGERYVSRLGSRLKPLLGIPLQHINSDVIANWRESRVETGDLPTIERVVQRRKFDADLKALINCLSRAVEWGVLADHELVRLPGRQTGTPDRSQRSSEAGGEG